MISTLLEETMPSYIGNTGDKINWNSIVTNLEGKLGFTDISDPVNVDASKSINTNEDFARNKWFADVKKYAEEVKDSVTPEHLNFLVNETNSTYQKWVDAGYLIHQISWEDYYPDSHFDRSLEDIFASITNTTPIPHRVFITRLRPGKVAPWHFDTLPDISKYKKLGKVDRWICFMHDPVPGQVMIINDFTFHNEKVGEIFKWDNRNNFHAAANASLKPYYMFHYEGYSNDT
jgi:hypothetical protein